MFRLKSCFGREKHEGGGVRSSSRRGRSRERVRETGVAPDTQERVGGVSERYVSKTPRDSMRFELWTTTLHYLKEYILYCIRILTLYLWGIGTRTTDDSLKDLHSERIVELCRKIF